MKRTALFLDFDGTLAPIHSHPDDVRLSPERENLLIDLSSKIPTIVLSGRSLPDLRKRLPVQALAGISGDHGASRFFRGRIHVPTGAQSVRPVVRRLGEALKETFLSWGGVYVEEKEYSVSVHFRNLDPDHTDAFRKILLGIVLPDIDRCSLIESKGKCVWEYRPPGLNKEDAFTWYLEEMNRGSESKDGFRPVMIGDDTTDWETVKRSVRMGGEGYWVGESLPEFDASITGLLRSPDDVWAYLEGLYLSV